MSSVTSPHSCKVASNMESLPKKRTVRVESVNSSWLYNRLQTEGGMILVDARCREEYEKDTIRSAVNLPPASTLGLNINHSPSIILEEIALPEQRNVISRRKLAEVILFIDVGRVIKNNDEWAWKLGQVLVEEGLVSCVKFMEDGFITFRYRYPFLTTDFDRPPGLFMRTPDSLNTVAFPNEILNGFLYFGNMWQASHPSVIEYLHITHVVNASLDVGNLFADQGVEYFNVRITDEIESDITSFLNPVYQFIENAKRQQPRRCRVLVHCTQGVSRSGSLVIYYLMRSFKWSLVTATNHTMACREVVYPNIGFLQQLLTAEYKLYHANSLTSEELLDVLLDGGIPDRPTPLLNRDDSGNKATNCGLCKQPFSFFGRRSRHHCNYCNHTICSNCSPSRLAQKEVEQQQRYDDEPGCDQVVLKPYRVCNACVSRLWTLTLPPTKLTKSIRKYKTMILRTKMSNQRPIRLHYLDNTAPPQILEMIRIRFNITKHDILDLTLENGEPIVNLCSLPSPVIVFVSIGSAGTRSINCLERT